MIQKQDYIGLEIPRSLLSRSIPSYGDPQFDSINTIFHDLEWEIPLAIFEGESDDDDGDIEPEMDEG